MVTKTKHFFYSDLGFWFVLSQQFFIDHFEICKAEENLGPW